jgi:hypothetical protein
MMKNVRSRIPEKNPPEPGLLKWPLPLPTYRNRVEFILPIGS